MIKKYIYCLLLLVSCLSLLPTLYGCQMKEDDLFEMDAANRSDAWMADYRRVFNNNKYGWALYTDNPTYGRHPSVATYAVKFDQVYSTFYKSISTVRLPGVADSSITMPTSPSILHRICKETLSSVLTDTRKTRILFSVAERPDSCPSS